MSAKLLDALGEGFFKVDREGHLHSINEAGARALGYPDSHVLLADQGYGREFLAHFAGWKPWLESLSPTGLPATRRFELYRRNGTQLIIEAVILEEERGGSGDPETVYVGAFHDITASEQLAGDLVERNTELEFLRRLAVDAVRLEDKPELFARMLQCCIQAVGADGGALYLVDPLEPLLVLEAWDGLPEDFVDRVRSMEFGMGHTGTAARTKEPCFIEDAARDPGLNIPEYHRLGINNFVSNPLIMQGRLLGVLNLFTVRNNRFTTRDMGMLKALAAQMSLSIAHVRRIDELRERNEELEKFNRLAIDRELRMIELKKRIAELEQQLPATVQSGTE